MMDTLKKLSTKWQSDGVSVNNYPTLDNILIFEKTYNVLLPKDLKSYFLEFNGTDGLNVCDLFTFLSFNDFLSINPQKDSFKPKNLQPLNSYFKIAEYNFNMFEYYIVLENNPNLFTNHVIIIDEVTSKIIADNFTDFLNLYVKNSELLYGSTL